MTRRATRVLLVGQCHAAATTKSHRQAGNVGIWQVMRMSARDGAKFSSGYGHNRDSPGQLERPSASSATPCDGIIKRQSPVWMEETVVGEHDEDTAREAGQHGYERRKPVPECWIDPQVPEHNEGGVLDKDNNVIRGVLVASRFILDIEETEEVDGTDEHVEEVLFAGTRLAGVRVTEAGALMHYPDGHDAPMADAHGEEPVVVFGSEQGQGQHAGSDGAQSPQELECGAQTGHVLLVRDRAS